MTTPLWTSKQSGQAFCDDCGWTTQGANCVGNAARHYRKTGHVVRCDVYRSIIVGESAPGKREPRASS